MVILSFINAIDINNVSRDHNLLFYEIYFNLIRPTIFIFLKIIIIIIIRIK